jgi:GGDEF domain-containing protein
MISLTKYIAESFDELTTARLRVPYALVEALAAHSIKYDPAKYDLNQAALRKLRGDLETAKNSTDVLQVTGAIVRTIETYNRGVARCIELRTQEMNTVVSMLMGKLQELAEANGTSAENLRCVGRKLEKAARIGDVRVLKEELAESLQGVQQEAAHQQEQSAAIRTHAREFISKIGLPTSSAEDSDPATGLPGFHTAELAIQEAIASQVHAYVVLFTVALGSLTRRFGNQCDDEALASFARQIASNLGPGDLLFRWKGATLMALLERPDSNEAVPPEISRMAAFPPEFTLEIDGKSMKIPLSMSSISVRLVKYDNLQAVREVMDQFQHTVTPGPVQEPAAAPQGV